MLSALKTVFFFISSEWIYICSLGEFMIIEISRNRGGRGSGDLYSYTGLLVDSALDLVLSKLLSTYL